MKEIKFTEVKEKLKLTPGNDSGERPFGARMLVKMESIANKSSSGIITMTDEAWEMAQRGVVKGMLVAKGAKAWDYTSDAPEIGDYVIIKRYAGICIPAEDGFSYRSCLDTDLVSVSDNDRAVETIG